MKTQKLLSRVVALAFCVSNSATIAAETEASVLIKPLMATSHASGTKHILSFFVTENGACSLTVVVSELNNERAEPAVARMLSTVEPLKSSRLDIADGKSIQFVCGQSASSMTIFSIDHVSYLEERQGRSDGHTR